MRFILKKSSDWGFRDEIEINTLEELVEFMRKDADGTEVILGEHDLGYGKSSFYLEIYDGHRE